MANPTRSEPPVGPVIHDFMMINLNLFSPILAPDPVFAELGR